MLEVTRLDELFEGYPDHLSVDDLARVLGVGRQTVYNWLRDGTVPAYQVGRSWIIVRDEVKDHLAARRNRPMQ